MSKALDLKGRRFGRLTVLERAENDKWGRSCWSCKCECGVVKTIRGNDLMKGDTRSCGCFQKEATAKLATQFHVSHPTHGLSKSRLYRIYTGMKDRCFNKNCVRYRHYGGKGITVCDEWLKFEAFRDWALSNGYREDLTIERVNVNGDYCPENCTWIMLSEQSKNRTNTVSYLGTTQTDWTKRLCVSSSALEVHRKRHNCSLEKAVRYYLLQKFI